MLEDNGCINITKPGMIKDIALNEIQFVNEESQDKTMAFNDLTYDSYKNSHQSSLVNQKLFLGSNMYEKVNLSNF